MSTSTASLPRRWQDTTNLVLGILLLISPWALGYDSASAAAWNAWVMGVWVALGAGLALADMALFVEWIVAFGGLWLFLSPRILAFTDHSLATVVQAAFGGVIAFLALWAGVARARARNLAAAAEGPSVKPPSRPTTRKAA